MANTITISLETENEEELYPLLNHVFREITERDYKNYEVEFGSKPDGEWLEVMGQRIKGRYRWNKL